MTDKTVELNGAKFKRATDKTILSGWLRYVRGPHGDMIWRSVPHTARHLIPKIEAAAKAVGI